MRHFILPSAVMIEDEIPRFYGGNAAYSGRTLAITWVFIRRQWVTVYHKRLSPQGRGEALISVKKLR